MKRANEPGSVWQQQIAGLQQDNDDRNPRQAFLEDFEKQIQEWLEDGDQLIIGGDINESVFKGRVQKLFEKYFLRNIIFSEHEPIDVPKSYYRTADERVIDGLWCTPGIRVTRCGYLAPQDFFGNHSLFWADVTYNSALGHKSTTTTSSRVRCLPKVSGLLHWLLIQQAQASC